MTSYFLLVYDRSTRQLVRVDEFTDAAVATVEYDRAESEHVGDESTEIVLVGADSLETLKQTHGHYFANGGDQGTAGGSGWTGVATAALGRTAINGSAS